MDYVLVHGAWHGAWCWRRVLPGLWAAGDYVAGPYPATLEGAVMAGEAAMASALQPG